MFKKLFFVLFCTLPLFADETVSNLKGERIERYGLRVHVQQSSDQFDKVCSLVKIDSPAFVGFEHFTGLLILMVQDRMTGQQLKALLERESYTAEVILLHRVNYTLPPNMQDEVVAGRLCIMQDPRMCIMHDKTTWSWRPVASEIKENECSCKKGAEKY